MIVAIIPARKNSKRIKNKNIKKFFNKPIISYSIEAAKKSKIFDKVIVSTDCKKIAKISKMCGAETPFVRPRELSDDFTGTNDVIKHAINFLRKNNQKITYVCCIYPAAPLITPELLKKGFKLLKQNKTNFSFVATKFEAPFERRLIVSKNLETRLSDKKCLRIRSQDLKVYYYDAGQFYWAKPDSFINYDDIFETSTSALVVSPHKVSDINDINDWKMAEAKFKINKK
jgi:pseudaminic acid cytidylyltransferase